MKPDTRRGRGCWRGCHAIKDHDLVSPGSRYKKHIGLAMGRTYYYYYEVNGSIEVCDSSMPSTTVCPSLPGQKVNTLYIPEERSIRQRRASLSSLSKLPFRTMDPNSKFVTPQPVPASHSELSMRRIRTAAPTVATFNLCPKDETETLTSPIKSPWKRFFPKTFSSKPHGARGRSISDDSRGLVSASPDHDIRPQTASSGTRTRDISPNSLLRFLSDGMEACIRPLARASLDQTSNSRKLASLQLDQVDEDDDDNFLATGDETIHLAVEEPAFTTRLSPPPFKRTISPVIETSSSKETVVPSSTLNLRSALQEAQEAGNAGNGLRLFSVPQQPRLQLSVPQSPSPSVAETYAQSTCPSSTLSSTMNSPTSPTMDEFPSQYDGLQDDYAIKKRATLPRGDETAADTGVNCGPVEHVKAPLTTSFSTYRLPQLTLTANKPTGRVPDTKHMSASRSPLFAAVDSAMLLAGQDAATVGNNGAANLLGSSFDMGLDEFATELRWVADVITTRID